MAKTDPPWQIIVTDNPSGPKECGPTASDIIEAMEAGPDAETGPYDYGLVLFRTSEVWFDKPIDLSYEDRNHYAFVADGFENVVCYRDFADGPLLTSSRAADMPYYIKLVGLTFDGRRSIYPTASSPLISLRKVDGSWFERCCFCNNAATGTHIGFGVDRVNSIDYPGNFSMSRFLSCSWLDNGGAGFYSHSAEDLTFLGCEFNGNTNQGAEVIGTTQEQFGSPSSGNNLKPIDRGLLQFIGCRFNDNDQNRVGIPGLALHDLLGASVEHCRFRNNNLLYAATTMACNAERNTFDNCAMIADDSTFVDSLNYSI